MAETENVNQVVFISRAGENRDVARHVADVLQGAGFETFLQDDNFGHTSFMKRMAQGFGHVDRGGCLVALLSQEYQQSDFCLKEAWYPLSGDTFNTQEKLVVFRIDDTQPKDFLKDIPYIDLSQICQRDPEFDEAVVSAVGRSLSIQCAVGAQTRSIEKAKVNTTKIDKLMTFLENEDAEEHGKAMLTVIALFSAIGIVLILFEQFLSFWNWIFGTSYDAIFDTSSVIVMWLLSTFAMIFAGFWMIRTATRTIEDANLNISQLKDLRSRVAGQSWKSEWFVRAVIQTATRNITSRR